MELKFFILPAYILLFFLSIILIGWTAHKHRARRVPFKSDTKVLRQPGESLRNKIAELDEEFFPKIVQASLVPLAAGGICIEVARRLPTVGWIIGALAAGALVFALAFVFAARWAAKKQFERANYQVGWFGERVVGDLLSPLERQGWRIFHDVPRKENGKPFNVDHVAIGPGGIFVIETKSRRKKSDDEGGHVVTFDGTVLHWPWGTDRHGIDQVKDNAAWLQRWLEESTGEDLPVESILTFPNWLVNGKTDGIPRVVNSKWIPGILTARAGVLTEKQIDLAARQLDGVCRDVGY